MKKLIVVIMLLISSFSYYGAVDENGEKITDLQNIVGVENEVQNEVTENEIQEIAEENTVDEVNETENIEQVEIAIEQPKEESKVSQNVNAEIQTKENKQPEIQKTTPKQEQVNTSVAETPKKEEQQPQQQTTKTITESDLEYWCVAGGSHHIAGDRVNEHGYYSSWNEANQAFENYTKGWASVQYKISQCSCGLYYFWAIQ